MKFYICPHCKNIITLIYDSGVDVVCCGEPMQELTVNTTDASHEKHVPVVTADNNKVTVRIGSADHPMVPEHYIEWIFLQTKTGCQGKYLKPGDEPEVCFLTCEPGDGVAAYAYCNLHGLWKSDVK
ncbi:MAG: desulfoferrodoxin family protein [Eubacteriales bacterium]|nr:desulfoferrodoxin family protein [Eubacteriales bacterium]